MMLTNHVVLFVLTCGAVAVLAAPSSCPSDLCRCEDGTPEKGRIINCRAMGITQIPTFKPTNEVFYELTLANTVGCSDCNNITVIPDNAFAGLKVKVIDLSKNNIQSVSLKAFASLAPTLREISIEGNRRSPPPYRALSVLRNLKTLTLRNFNQLYMSKYNTDLRQFNNLEVLILKNMEISHIREDVFKDRLPNLKRLQLEFLPLGSLPTFAMQHLRSLESLRAINIEITEIPYGAFSSFRKLRELDLSHNEIRSMKPGCFNGIENSLEYLGLHLNKLNEINVGPLAATRWTNLTQLNLGHNRMTSLPIGLFFNMKKLQYLNLDSNKITFLEAGTFQGLQSLAYLDISYNKLPSLSAGVFLHTPRLTKLDVRGEDTPVFNISRADIQGLENTLEDLILTDTVVYEQDMWRALSALSKLQVLELGGTRLTHIPDLQFVNNRNLTTLSLDRNGISQLSQKTFHGLALTLKNLNLQGNDIETINKCVLKSLTNLEMLNLGRNPLNCDCESASLRNWIVARISKNYFFEYMVDAMCATPVAHAGLAVWDMPEDQLTCAADHVITKCETIPDILTTTAIPPAEITSGVVVDEHVMFRLARIVETDTTIEIDWSFFDERMVSGSKLEYQLLGQNSENKIIDMSASLNNYVISGLQSDSSYLVCLSVQPRNLRILTLNSRKVCVAVKTLA